MNDEEYEQGLLRHKCLASGLFFTQYFFLERQNIKFKTNWHHHLVNDELEKVIKGETQNLIINIPPGSSKTEMAVINFMSRGLALNPRARFLHLSGSDMLASLNSETAREIVRSDQYQKFWPYKVADDTSSKKRWNIMLDGRIAGGVYATSFGGQVTGFRAGHMAEGFQGAIVIDDPIKPEDAYSRPAIDKANRTLITTIKSRKANPKTPIVIIMQRVAENDPTGFILAGNVEGDWKHVKIPAVLDQPYLEALAKRYRELIDDSDMIDDRISYWPYKEPLKDLLEMERGGGKDEKGKRVSRHVFAGQYMQNPIAFGGNIIRGEHFIRYTWSVPPKIKYRLVYADTAQKTKEQNDYSVFQCWGMADNGKIYLLDLLRGKWESPELRKTAAAFWAKQKGQDLNQFGALRKFKPEDASSGTDLIQSLKLAPYNIPIEGIERDKDKLTRVMDVLPYIESGQVCIPEDAPFTNDFVAECESFTADDSHEHDDQVDPLVDAIKDLLSTGNKLKQWESLANATKKG